MGTSACTEYGGARTRRRDCNDSRQTGCDCNDSRRACLPDMAPPCLRATRLSILLVLFPPLPPARGSMAATFHCPRPSLISVSVDGSNVPLPEALTSSGDCLKGFFKKHSRRVSHAP